MHPGDLVGADTPIGEVPDGEHQIIVDGMECTLYLGSEKPSRGIMNGVEGIFVFRKGLVVMNDDKAEYHEAAHKHIQ